MESYIPDSLYDCSIKFSVVMEFEIRNQEMKFKNILIMKIYEKSHYRFLQSE